MVLLLWVGSRRDSGSSEQPQDPDAIPSEAFHAFAIQMELHRPRQLLACDDLARAARRALKVSRRG